ncbi:MAG: hypothetical protein KGI37_04105 [Alphaproteobacteria bacterium]|nr:hypothetical protein [Alphaproteobacteria bacterium]
MADDTTQAFPKAIWDIVRPQLAAEHIIATSLKAAPVTIDGQEMVSVTDIGPILAAVGQAKFWQMVRHAAAQVEPYKSGAPVTVYHEVLCALVCAADPIDAPYKLLSARKPFNLYTPNGLLGNVDVPVSDRIVTADHFLCLPGRPDESLASIYDTYVFNDSARRDIHDQAWAYIKEREADINAHFAAPAGLSSANDNFKASGQSLVTLGRKDIKRKARRARAMEMSSGPSDGRDHYKIGNTRVERVDFLSGLASAQRPDDTARLDEGFLNAKSMRFEFAGQKNATHPDIVVLGPFDPNDEVARIYHYTMLHAANVAKATDPACQDMQIFVMDLQDETGKGCYEDYFASHEAYADGYNKEYKLPLSHKGLKEKISLGKKNNTEHTAYCFVDRLSGTDLDQMRAAASKLVLAHQRTYRRLESEVLGTQQSKETIPDDVCQVTVFASAGSDRLDDHNNGTKLGGLLAERSVDTEMGIRTGAGDDHAMWFPVKAYLEKLASLGKKPRYLYGTTTHALARTETKHGAVAPEFTHHSTHDLIGPRQHELMKGDLFVSLGGGNGTGFETGEVLLLKKLGHPLMRGKEIFFVGKTPSMHKEIISYIGQDKFEELLRDPLALRKEGIYLFATTDEARPHILASIDRVEARKKAEKDFAATAAARAARLTA